jgi:hypothetical protein
VESEGRGERLEREKGKDRKERCLCGKSLHTLYQNYCLMDDRLVR